MSVFGLLAYTSYSSRGWSVQLLRRPGYRREQEYVTYFAALYDVLDRDCFLLFSSCAEVQELLPGIISQLGPDSISSLRSILSQLKGAAPAGGDEDIPDLVDNVE